MSISLLLGALLLTASPTVDEPWRGVSPAAIHLGSYSSQLSARLGQDGSLDTGAVVARVLDLQAGRPLDSEDMHFGLGPTLWVQWNHEAGGYRVQAQAAANGASATGDVRLTAALRLLVESRSEQAEAIHLAVELSSGNDPGLPRPTPSLPFVAGETWSQDGALILRNDQVVAGWPSGSPELQILDRPSSPQDTAVRLSWAFTLPAGESRYVELFLSGAPSTEVINEDRWRTTLARNDYRTLAEELGWQSQFNGAFGKLRTAEPRFRDAMVAAVAQIRTLGVANKRVRSLTDRPYGQPASDAAVEAQMLGLLFEYGIDEISTEFLDELLNQGVERMQGLSLERRLMYLHGLARAVRLAGVDTRDLPMAALVLEFLLEEPGELAVDPWLDPEHVRQDLLAVLERAGRGGAELMPRLHWGAVDPGSKQEQLQVVLRDLDKRDGAAAWAKLTALFDGLTRRGFGSLDPSGEPDGLFSLALGSVLREVLIDDHGEDLHFLPGACYGLLGIQNDVETDWMPCRWGIYKQQQYHTGPRLLGGWMHLNTAVWPKSIVMFFPPDAGLRKLKGEPDGGQVRVLDQRSVQLFLSPLAVRGLRFQVRRANKGGDGGDGGDEDEGEG